MIDSTTPMRKASAALSGRLIEHEAVAHITTMQALNHLIDLIQRQMLHLGFDVAPHSEVHYFPNAPWRRHLSDYLLPLIDRRK